MTQMFFSPESRINKSLQCSDIDQFQLKSSQLTENFVIFKSVVYCPSQQEFPCASGNFEMNIQIEDGNGTNIDQRQKKYSDITQDQYKNQFGRYSQTSDSAQKQFAKSDFNNVQSNYSGDHKKVNYKAPISQDIELNRPLIGITLNESIDLQGDILDKFQEPQQKKKGGVKSSKMIMKKIQKLQENSLIDKYYQTWSWDTSGALIRLMQRSKITRFIMNIYIWILIIIRVFYFAVLGEYIIKNRNNLMHYEFFWLTFSVYFGVRVMFALIVLKIFSYGNNIGDLKIKIVSETYRDVFARSNFRKIMMVIIPPELSFVFIAPGLSSGKNGYYQVQNMIMKTLEIFFFIPFVTYFLHLRLQIQREIMNLSYEYILFSVLAFDVLSFTLLTTFLLVKNQKRKLSLKRE